MPHHPNSAPSNATGSTAPARRRLWRWLLPLLILLLAGLIYAQPYWTLYQFRQAIEQRDAARINDLVDYPALQQGLTSQLQQVMAQHMPAIPNDTVDQLSRMLTQRMISATVTQIASADGLQQALALESANAVPPAPAKTNAQGTSIMTVQDYGYDSFNQFGIRVYNQHAPDQPLQLILTRQGMGWRLTNILLPASRPGTV